MTGPQYLEEGPPPAAPVKAPERSGRDAVLAQLRKLEAEAREAVADIDTARVQRGLTGLEKSSRIRWSATAAAFSTAVDVVEAVPF